MTSTMQMQSISGIITQIHATLDEVPPALVGASVNIIGNKVYVFAGRLATSRKMTNYLNILDLHTLQWSRHIPPPDSDKPPKSRYFHSASVYKDKQLIIFGGMGYSRISTEGLCVLDDITTLDVETMCWRRPHIQPSLYSPQSRYAHLGSITDDKLIIIGGQDLDNNYLDEMNVLNLETWEWEQVKTFEKHVGAYRSVAVTAPPGIKINALSSDTNVSEDNTEEEEEEERTNMIKSAVNQELVVEENAPVYLYTNYNFADVRRELQLIYSTTHIEEVSHLMTNNNNANLPPGLRFPTGSTLGNHLILAGTYLSPQSQSYSIWSLDLSKLTWSRIETGTVFNSGSWNKGVLYEDTNKFIVFGNTSRNLLDDYNHRQVNFDHIAMVDLEAFGIYALPKSTCSSLAQEMGLRLLNEPAVSDFTIITLDNMSIPVNSAVLSQRWPYFNNLMKSNHQVIKSTNSHRRTSSIVPVTNTEPVPSTSTSTAVIHKEFGESDRRHSLVDSYTSSIADTIPIENSSQEVIEEEQEPKKVNLIKSHYMSFPYPHTVVIALLQFIYTDNLLTAQQYQPHILSQLLLLSDMYDIPRLGQLSTHALHQMLNISTAPLIFETAALSHQTSLQIRALKMMIAAKKMIQKQQQQQQQQRPRTMSMPVTATASSSAASSIHNLNTEPISPTNSLPSTSRLSFNNGTVTTASSILDSSIMTGSPTLQSFRSSSIRKPSLSAANNRSTYQPSNSNRTSTFSSSNLYTRNTYTSPPATPKFDLEAASPQLTKSTENKNKKKKKAFLEVFWK